MRGALPQVVSDDTSSTEATEAVPVAHAANNEVTLALHKPRGFTSDNNHTGKFPSAYALLPEHLSGRRGGLSAAAGAGVRAVQTRLGAVGRLDVETSGLLLFTSSPLVNRHVRAAKRVPKTYVATVAGCLLDLEAASEPELRRMLHGDGLIPRQACPVDAAPATSAAVDRSASTVAAGVGLVPSAGSCIGDTSPSDEARARLLAALQPHGWRDGLGLLWQPLRLENGSSGRDRRPLESHSLVGCEVEAERAVTPVTETLPASHVKVWNTSGWRFAVHCMFLPAHLDLLTRPALFIRLPMTTMTGRALVGSRFVSIARRASGR